MKIGIFANLSKPEALTAALSLACFLKERNIQFFYDPDLADALQAKEQLATMVEFVNSMDIIVTLGGDGTILRCVREIGASETPVLGIHMGGLGFLTAATPDGLFEMMKNILAGEYEISHREMLCCTISMNEKTTSKFKALNDIVVDRGSSIRMARLGVFIDGYKLSSFFADWLIFSTATGSTAYNLAAAGPIITPGVHAFVINAINPHSLAVRPVVIHADSKLTVINEDENPDLILSVDGQTKYALKSLDQIEFSVSKTKANLVMPKNYTIFNVLADRLFWNRDGRPEAQRNVQ